MANITSAVRRLPLKATINILPEGVPEGLEFDAIEKALLVVPGVAGLHDLHVWALSSGKNSLSAHLVIAPDASPG